MRKSLVLIILLSMSVSTAVCAKIGPVPHLKGADKNFMQKTALEEMTQIELAQVGERRAYDQQLKNLAAKMIADYTIANNSLKELADAKGMRLPSELDRKHKILIAKFSKLSGSKFDHNYIEQMLKDSKQNLSELENEKKRVTTN